MDEDKQKQIVRACLMAAGEPVSLDRLIAVFADDKETALTRDDVRNVLDALREDALGSGVELVEVASGYRYQAVADTAPWVNRLWEERRPRYSRALMETLAIIAYRQPITRGEIESIRGVAVSTNIVKTLDECGWVRVVGHRDVPGRPAIFATTRGFLDYFNLRSLEDLPSLAELQDIDDINADLFSNLPSDDAADESTKAAGEQSEQNEEQAANVADARDDAVADSNQDAVADAASNEAATAPVEPDETQATDGVAEDVQTSDEAER